MQELAFIHVFIELIRAFAATNNAAMNIKKQSLSANIF
jgi:hypothetical protein